MTSETDIRNEVKPTVCEAARSQKIPRWGVSGSSNSRHSYTKTKKQAKPTYTWISPYYSISDHCCLPTTSVNDVACSDLMAAQTTECQSAHLRTKHTEWCFESGALSVSSEARSFILFSLGVSSVLFALDLQCFVLKLRTWKSFKYWKQPLWS